MFATAFPCHECSRHIVAAGIKQVTYLEPYPKSATADLYRDSIAIDPSTHEERKVIFRTFVGVAPARYLEFFSLADRDRKNDIGKVEQFKLSGSSVPHLPYYTPTPDAIPVSEVERTSAFREFLKTATPDAATIDSGPKTLP